MKLSACIEWLFADEAEAVPDRIRLARQAGLDAIEFWLWSNKDIDGIARALEETGLGLSGFVAEPMIPLTDPANKDAFLAGLERSIAVARRLGAGVLIAQAGNDLEGRSREEQRSALRDCLKAAAEILAGTGVRLGVEPLNTLIDHRGYYLPSTGEALDIVDDVARPEIGIVYDLYHSYVMGEAVEEVLAGRVDRVLHAHVADHPGRQDPGTGEIDLASRLRWLFANGYTGRVGLEYRPSRGTSAAMPEVLHSLGVAVPN
jgi:hydroxypyruvate isomerase